MPAVSVIIPVYNAERFLAACLDDIFAQTCKDIEVICVNDGSTDNSTSILDDYACRDERLRIITQRNQGVSGARNTGLARASGEYVLFFDADDTCEPTMLEEAYDRATSDDADIVIYRFRYAQEGQTRAVDSSGSLRTDLLPDHAPFTGSEVAGTIFDLTTPCVWNKLFRRSFLVDAALQFDSSLLRAEDLPFTYLALMVARRITTLDRALVDYRIGNGESLQDTVHEEPLAICESLAALQRGAQKAGVYDTFERDLANLALYQCVFTLDSLRTPEAFGVLYDSLKARYFSELGIAGRTPDYFFSARDYERYCMIVDMPFEEYLFRLAHRFRSTQKSSDELLMYLIGRTRTLRKKVESIDANTRDKKKKLRKAQRRLRSVRSSWAYKIDRLLSSANRGIGRVFGKRGKA